MHVFLFTINPYVFVHWCCKTIHFLFLDKISKINHSIILSNLWSINLFRIIDNNFNLSHAIQYLYFDAILILIFQKSGIKVSRNNCFIFCSKKRDESTIEEDRTIYISNCSARENQLICVTMLRKLPWKRTGCTMGCCIGRQALSRVSLFHPTDMSNAGCISIYAPSQNSPRRGRASFSLPFSPPFSYSRRLVDVRRGISFRYHVCSYDSRCNVPATQVNRFCRFSEWKYFFEEVGFVAWNNFINGYKNHKIILIARKSTNPFIVHFSQYCTKFRDLILKLGKVKIPI